MNDHILYPIKVRELYRNATSVMRTSDEAAQDSLFGLPGHLVPLGWLRVEKELTRKFGRSAKTIEDIISLLRIWEETALGFIRESLEIHPVLDPSDFHNNRNASVIRFVLVPKGTRFPTLTAEETKFYESVVKYRTGILDCEEYRSQMTDAWGVEGEWLDIYEWHEKSKSGLANDCSDWRRYWTEDCGIESDESRTHVFRNLELSEALDILADKPLAESQEAKEPPKTKKLTNKDRRNQRDEWLLDLRGVGEEPLCTWEEALELLSQKYDETSWPDIHSRGAVEAAWKRAYEKRFNKLWDIDNRGKNKGKKRKEKTDHEG